MPAKETVLKKVVLSRYLYELAEENIQPQDPIKVCVGVNLLQDSVETYLLAIAEEVSADITQKTFFEQYFDKINERLPEGGKLPGRTRLIALNKVRVNSKHYAIQPEVSEAVSYLTTVRDFFEETAADLLGVKWSSVTLADLLRQGETKNHVIAAHAAFDDARYDECLIECRKALYLDIEQQFVTHPSGENGTLQALAGRLSRAPAYARDRTYIEQAVKDPTDYVVYDYSELHRLLDEYGIHATDYWNVWRLTPEVFEFPNGTWAAKVDFRKLHPDVMKGNAEYVLHATVRMLLARQRAATAVRTARGGRYHVVLKNDGVPVYEKADCGSETVGQTPPGIRGLPVDFLVEALKPGGGRYYHGWLISEKSVWGYISEADVESVQPGWEFPGLDEMDN